MDPGTAAAWRDLYFGTVGAGASLTGRGFVLLFHQIQANRLRPPPRELTWPLTLGITSDEEIGRGKYLLNR